MDRTNFPETNSSIAEKTFDKRRPPFKLCFSKDRLLGRSNLRTLKIEGDPITRKFYSTKYDNRENEDENENEEGKTSETLKESADQRDNAWNRINRRPRLTSHAYGWWHEQGLQPTESRINFRKKTSDLVNFQMKIYAEDQKLKNLKTSKQ